MKRFTRVATAAALLIGLAAAPAMAQTLRPTANGSFGQVRLSSGFTPDPHSVTVRAGGALDAATVVGGSCTGNIADKPDYTVRYRAGSLPLIFSATSAADTTLVVRDPNGTFSCDDDSAGNLNPTVRISAPRSGRYSVWVGTFSSGGETPDAVLHVSEIGAQTTEASSVAAPDVSQNPAYGSVTLRAGFRPDPHTVAISAGGGYDASQLQQGCTGFVATAPDYRVNYENGSLPLIFSVASDADTTLLINAPDGTWVCDDDSGNAGLNPMIRFNAPQSGQYDVWVGTFAAGALSQSTLNVSELTSQ